MSLWTDLLMVFATNPTNRTPRAKLLGAGTWAHLHQASQPEELLTTLTAKRSSPDAALTISAPSMSGNAANRLMSDSIFQVGS